VFKLAPCLRFQTRFDSLELKRLFSRDQSQTVYFGLGPIIQNYVAGKFSGFESIPLWGQEYALISAIAYSTKQGTLSHFDRRL
jgi:hypothetical protein